MKKRGKKKDSFTENVTSLLSSIAQTKKELGRLKNEELKKLTLSEKEQIKLIKLKTNEQKKKVIERYEKKKENLGKALLRRKNQELGRHLSIERKSLSKTNTKLSRIGREQRKFKK